MRVCGNLVPSMDAVAKQFLINLLNTPSPTGFELPGQRVWAADIRGVSDQVENDAYGSAWATLAGTGKGADRGPRIMLEAHADEIGFIVKQITKEGFLRLDRIGGADTATARGRRLQILGDKGTVRGIIGNTAIHLRRDGGEEKAPKIHELYVDVGASNAEEVALLGLRVGHPAVYADAAEEMGEHLLISRAIDNRIGSFILARVLANLSKQREAFASTVYAVNAVQEEIGGNGARMVAHRLHPDLCIVLDVTHATDTPGINHAQHGEVKLGAGPTVTHGTCNHPQVVARLIEVAAREGIPLQHESSSRYSGTDTDVIFHSRDGIPSALVSLPLRYMHSVVEMVDLRDVQKVIDLLSAFVLSVSADERFHAKL